jgi:hypothetical protein
MPIINQSIIEDAPQASGRRRLQFEFIDHLGKPHQHGPMIVDAIADADAILLSLIPEIEAQLASDEIREAIDEAIVGNNPDKVSEYQPQSDFDRRVLGQAMLLADAHTVHAVYPMFQAVESRGGANAGQRATYLGLARAHYDLIAARFNNVNGVAWFLNDEKNQIWLELPEGFE